MTTPDEATRLGRRTSTRERPCPTLTKAHTSPSPPPRSTRTSGVSWNACATRWRRCAPSPPRAAPARDSVEVARRGRPAGPGVRGCPGLGAGDLDAQPGHPDRPLRRDRQSGDRGSGRPVGAHQPDHHRGSRLRRRPAARQRRDRCPCRAGRAAGAGGSPARPDRSARLAASPTSSMGKCSSWWRARSSSRPGTAPCRSPMTRRTPCCPASRRRSRSRTGWSCST